MVIRRDKITQNGAAIKNQESNEIPITKVTTAREYRNITENFISENFEEISSRERKLLEYHIHLQGAPGGNIKHYLEYNLNESKNSIKTIIAGMAHDYELHWIEEDNEYQHEFITKLCQHPIINLEKKHGRNAIIHRLDVTHHTYRYNNISPVNIYSHVKTFWAAECKRMEPVIKFIRDKNSTPEERIKIIWKRLCSDIPQSMHLVIEFKSEHDVLSKMSEFSEDYPATLISKIKNSLAASNSRKNNKGLNQFNVQLAAGSIKKIETIAESLNIRKRDVIEILVNSEIAMQICIDAVRRKAECELKDRLQGLDQIKNIPNKLP